jgi:hypothetical protein
VDTLTSVPLCMRPLETGCLVAYRSTHADALPDPRWWPPPAGAETACVDPVALDLAGSRDETHRVSRAYFPRQGVFGLSLRGVEDVKTPFVSLPAFYEARCVRGDEGRAYLAIAPAVGGDARGPGPFDLEAPRLRKAGIGLHVADIELGLGDLIDIVARRRSTTP